MRNAVKISAGLHVLLIAVSLVNVPWGAPDPEEDIQVAQVSIMTESQFDAAISQAPDVVPMTTLNAMSAPSFSDFDAATPDAEMDVTINDVSGPDDPSAADAEADLSAVLVTNQVVVDSNVTTLAPALPGAFDTALNTPTSRPAEARPQSLSRPGGMSSPRPEAPSLRIDTTPAAPPPEDAEIADEAQEEVALSTDATVDQPVQEATAPEEAATEIVPEIADDLPEPEPAPLQDDLPDEPLRADVTPETGAPLASARPQARPEVREPVAEPVSEPVSEPVRTAEEPATAQPATEQPVTEQPTPAQSTPTPAVAQGPPISSGIIDLVKSGTQDRWNISFQGIENWQSFVVTVRFELSRDGQLLGDPVPIVPQRLDGGFSVAFDAARRAIVRAAREGVFANLPAESYGRWQIIEMTFDPSRGAVGIGS